MLGLKTIPQKVMLCQVIASSLVTSYGDKGGYNRELHTQLARVRVRSFSLLKKRENSFSLLSVKGAINFIHGKQ